jgi:hypothetical protein
MELNPAMRKTLRNAIIFAVIVLILLFIGFILAAVFNVLLEVLYVFLILLATFSLFSTGYLIYSLWLLNGTVKTVRDEMRPLLASVNQTADFVKDTAKSANQTATTISSTAQLTSEFAIDPSIRVTSALIAGQQMFRVLLGGGRGRSRSEIRRKQQSDALKASIGEGD